MQTTNSQGGIRTAMRFRTLSPYTGFNKNKGSGSVCNTVQSGTYETWLQELYETYMLVTLLVTSVIYTLLHSNLADWVSKYEGLCFWGFSFDFDSNLSPTIFAAIYIQKYIKIITLHQTAFTCVFSKNTFALVIMDGSLIFTVNTLFCLLPLGLFTRERKAEGSRF